MLLSEARQLANDLIVKHKLHYQGWGFRFDNAKTRLGCCKHSKKLITLSKFHTINRNYAEVKNTILHEIAHALTPRQNHNNVWKRKCLEIGCNANRTTKVTERPKPKYYNVCPNCGNKTPKYRKPRVRYSCGICSPVYDERYILKVIPA